MGEPNQQKTHNQTKCEAFFPFLVLKLYISLKTVVSHNSWLLHSQFLPKFLAFTLNYTPSTEHGLELFDDLDEKHTKYGDLNCQREVASLGVSLSFRKDTSHKASSAQQKE